jgi:SAM-dependent methyltransferase
VDAVLAATALHWIPTGSLTEVNRACGAVLRPGGLLINCDNLEYPPAATTIRRIADSVRAAERESAAASVAAEQFQGWEQ